MTSFRNGSTDDENLLDAARDCILAVGWRRTTMTDVARRSGVSRMTVYRRWPDMAALTTDLIDREFGLDDLVLLPPSATSDVASITSATVEITTRVTDHALFHKVVDVDPELLLPYLLEERGEPQELALAALTDAIRQGQRHGDVRRGRPEVLARSVLLLCQGFVLSSATMADGRYSERIARRELAHAIAAYLA